MNLLMIEGVVEAALEAVPGLGQPSQQKIVPMIEVELVFGRSELSRWEFAKLTRYYLFRPNNATERPGINNSP
jgi:hypothetical protein